MISAKRIISSEVMIMAKVRTIDAFIDGKCFARVKSLKGVDDLLKQISIEDPDAMDKIADEYKKDFIKHNISSNYYLMYYKKQHALKAMCAEFFDKIYNSGIRSPYIFEV